ncbi:hypothetical protein, partial [Sphingomonas zeicaulis]|uniref:hypothetical protein n=1 Tax=Sphingomonas zeicaulis TaxID=1632740 RepID=UPI003D1E9724
MKREMLVLASLALAGCQGATSSEHEAICKSQIIKTFGVPEDDIAFESLSKTSIEASKSPFENVLNVCQGCDSSLGCGPERAVAGWLDL